MTKFITLEGCEGCGKSTQAKLLKDYLESAGYKVLLTREPGGTKLAEDLRSILLSGSEVTDPLTEFMIISTARRDHVENLIKPALREGEWVICDRFYDSSLAYQGYAKGLDLKLMRDMISLSIGDFAPDLTLFIDMDPKASLERALKERDDNNHYDNKAVEFHNKVHQGFTQIAKENPDRVKVIDGNQDIESISKEIISYL